MRKRRSSPEKNYRTVDKTPGYRGPLADIESNYAALEHFKVEMRGGGDSAENRGARLNESLKREAFQRESTLMFVGFVAQRMRVHMGVGEGRAQEVRRPSRMVRYSVEVWARKSQSWKW